jgi:hypothetical protein
MVYCERSKNRFRKTLDRRIIIIVIKMWGNLSLNEA